MEVSLDEISRVIRLVREVCDRWDDPRAWREHLLRGACDLLHGNVGTIVDMGFAAPGRFGAIRALAAVGLPKVAPPRQLVDAGAAVSSHRDIGDVSENMAPGLECLFAEFNSKGWVTATRDQVTDPATYHASPMYRNFRRHADCDDFVWSMRFVDLPQRVESIGVDRPHGAAPFGTREITLLTLLHDEIAPLVGVRLATEEHLCRDRLTKRLRQTLSHLLDGMSEKQVALALRLSPRTVHEYAGMIYQHFRVNSRGELMAYFVRRTPKLRPIN